MSLTCAVTSHLYLLTFQHVLLTLNDFIKIFMLLNIKIKVEVMSFVTLFQFYVFICH